MKIYEYIKLLNSNDDSNSYNILSNYFLKHPQCLFVRKSYFTPFIYAASLGYNTLQKLYSIYLENIDNIPSLFINPYEYTNIDGYNLLHYTVKMMCKYKNINSELFKKYHEILHYIIHTMEMNINSKNNKGNTVLHTVVENNNMDLVKIFIYYNIDIDRENFKKETALQISYNNSNKEIFKYLLQKNANYYLLDDINEEFIQLIQEHKYIYGKKKSIKSKSKKIYKQYYNKLKELYIMMYNLHMLYDIDEKDKFKLVYKNDSDSSVYHKLIKYHDDLIYVNKKYFLHYYISNDNEDDYEIQITNGHDIHQNTIFNHTSLYHIFEDIFDDEYDLNKCDDVFDDDVRFLILTNMKRKIDNVTYIKNLDKYSLSEISNILLHKIMIKL